MVEKVINDSAILPTCKKELLLCLSALNLLNAWVKQIEYKNKLRPWKIKMQVSTLVKHLMEDKIGLAEEIEYNMGNQCLYIRCSGLQFSFHRVNLENLTDEQRDAITVNDNIWDGIRLQEMAEELYKTVTNEMANNRSEQEILDACLQNKK